MSASRSRTYKKTAVQQQKRPRQENVKAVFRKKMDKSIKKATEMQELIAVTTKNPMSTKERVKYVVAVASSSSNGPKFPPITTSCPRCDHGMTDAEADAGFTDDEADFTTCCTVCGHRFFAARRAIIVVNGRQTVQKFVWMCQDQTEAAIKRWLKVEDPKPENIISAMARHQPALVWNALRYFGDDLCEQIGTMTNGKFVPTVNEEEEEEDSN